MRPGPTIPVIKDVVLVGAGHAHVGVLRRFGMRPEPGVRRTLVTRRPDTPYSGMLPGQVAGLYEFDDTHIDVGPLCRFAGVRLVLDEAVGLDLAGRRVLCRERPPVPFDLLSIDIGSTPNTGAVPGAAEHALPVKPIDGFLGRFEALHARVLARGGRARVGIVGAGAGGVELCLSMERRLRRDLAAAGHDPTRLTFALVGRSAEVLPDFPAAHARALRRPPARARGGGVDRRAGDLRGGGRAPNSALVQSCRWTRSWTTQAAPAAWLRDTGLALDGRGFVRVRPTLESVSHIGVFAAGDVATLEGHDLPRSGVYAVREGPPLADNLRRALTGRALLRYRPQRDALYLISTGERHAIGARNGVVVEGDWVWRLKDWIDRRFMRRFDELPEMAAPTPVLPTPGVADTAALREISAIAMRCGGCGAKVGANGALACARQHRPDGARGCCDRPRRPR